MKKILFPTEFADHAPEVLRYASELAYFFKAKLIVMHAFGKPEIRTTDSATLEKKANTATDFMLEFVKENLLETHQKEIKIDYVVQVGFPAEAILHLAIEEEIDLIVMGNTGKTNAIGTIFGSTAQEVLTKANCPVLAVPAEAKFSDIDNIVYTTNFEFRDLEGINYLKKWSKAFLAAIHCVHVIENDEDQASAIRGMNILHETYKGHKKVHFDMVEGDFKEKIERFVKTKKADILAMMAHKRNFLSRILASSKVKGVSKRIPVPLLVIKDNPYELDTDAAKWIEMANSIA